MGPGRGNRIPVGRGDLSRASVTSQWLRGDRAVLIRAGSRTRGVARRDRRRVLQEATMNTKNMHGWGTAPGLRRAPVTRLRVEVGTGCVTFRVARRDWCERLGIPSQYNRSFQS